MIQKPTLIVVRHGDTPFNDNPQKLRGWLPLPLNGEGAQHARDGGQWIQEHFTPSLLYASSLTRSMMTASIIGKTLKLKVKPLNGLRDWNIGNLSGKPVDDYGEVLEGYMLRKADVPLPGGESFETFWHRLMASLQAIMKTVEGYHHPFEAVVVTHNRCIRVLLAAMASKNPWRLDKPTLIKDLDPVRPGGLLVLKKESVWKVDGIHQPGHA